MKIVTAILLSLLLLSAIVFGCFSLISYQQMVKNTAIDACYQVGTVSFFDHDKDGFVIRSSELPANDLYTQCMRAKGYTP